MTMRSVPRAQLALDETVITDAALERSLENRQDAKDANRETRAAYREADLAAKAEIERQEMPDGMVVRIGRFRLERKPFAARHVSFDTDPGSRVRISLVADD